MAPRLFETVPDPLPELILASGSPRRHQLLSDLGVRFTVVVSGAIELTAALTPKVDAELLTRENALRKARLVAQQRPASTILGVDTLVTINGDVLEKPADLAEAHRFLERLSGRTHRVVTACALIGSEPFRELFTVTSHVTFHPLTAATITEYLARVSVLDKAGGYALQEHEEMLVARVDGSRDNVIGLPTERLQPLLAAWIEPTSDRTRCAPIS